MKKYLLTAIVLVLVSNSVFAGRIWHYTTINPSMFDNSAVALRNGNVWPTVVAGNNATQAYVQTPIGWLDGPSVPMVGTYIRADSSSDGQVAFSNYNSVVTLDSSGWGTHGIGGSDIAFDNNGHISVVIGTKVKTFNGLSWDELDWNEQTPIAGRALAYDSYNQINVVCRDDQRLYLALYGTLTSNNWIFDTIYSHTNNIILTDVALTCNDIPVIAYTDSLDSLYINSYDIHSDSWQNAFISDVDYNSSFVLDSDSKGGIGLAYVSGQYLNYKYFDGVSWSNSDILAEASALGTIGLDFDYEDNPVVSFTGVNPEDNTTGLIIAYDPVVTPEPVTISILSLGGLLIARRRR